MTSNHWMKDREAREALIEKIGIGQVIKTVVVDKGHKNGPEIHELTSTGIVVIYNKRSHKMITKLIARPGQVRRYYKENEQVPTNVLKIAREHLKMGYNI